jgi:hypothetical protein
VQQLAGVAGDGGELEPVAADLGLEGWVGGQAHLVAGRLQAAAERQVGLHVAAGADGQDGDLHGFLLYSTGSRGQRRTPFACRRLVGGMPDALAHRASGDWG